MSTRMISGFAGGAALTSSAIFFSTAAHSQARMAQRALLQQQTEQLTRLCDGASTTATTSTSATAKSQQPVTMPAGTVWARATPALGWKPAESRNC